MKTWMYEIKNLENRIKLNLETMLAKAVTTQVGVKFISSYISLFDSKMTPSVVFYS